MKRRRCVLVERAAQAFGQESSGRRRRGARSGRRHQREKAGDSWAGVTGGELGVREHREHLNTVRKCCQE